MNGAFGGRQVEPAQRTRETELTLGWGSLLGIFCALVALCGLCFVMGYTLGHRSSGPSASSVPQPATEQEPLQASGAIPKPSAVAQTPVPQPPPSDATSPFGAATETAVVQGGAAVSTSSNVAPATAPANSANPSPQPAVQPALPSSSAAQGTASGGAQAVHSALPQPQAQQFMVQIAAISNADDAQVLVDALKKRDYPVVSKHESSDNFIHVRIGPFATRQIADQWRMKLLNDGYNAIVQP